MTTDYMEDFETVPEEFENLKYPEFDEACKICHVQATRYYGFHPKLPLCYNPACYLLLDEQIEAALLSANGQGDY